MKTARNMTTSFYVLLAILSALILPGCEEKEKNGPSSEIKGFLIDIATGEKIIDGSFSIVLDTASKQYEGKYESSNGRYLVAGLPDKKFDYTITITDKNELYSQFTSTNRFQPRESLSTGSNVTIDCEYMHNIPLASSDLQIGQVKISVVDGYSGENLAGGNYKLIRNSPCITEMYQSTSSGTTAAEELFLNQDALPIQGSFNEGAITIDAGILLYGYDYTFQIWNVEGYNVYDSTGLVTINPYTYSSTNGYTAGLRPTDSYTDPRIIGISNWNGDNFTQATDRVMTITFDQNISIDKTGILYTGADMMLTRITSDTDGDGSLTASVAVETPTTYSTVLTLAANTNQLTITLAADATIIGGTIDTDDNLSYEFNDAFFQSALLIRGSGDTYEGTTLGTLLTTYKGDSELYFVVR